MNIIYIVAIIINLLGAIIMLFEGKSSFEPLVLAALFIIMLNIKKLKDNK